jgi:hypothetical protein
MNLEPVNGDLFLYVPCQNQEMTEIPGEGWMCQESDT